MKKEVIEKEIRSRLDEPDNEWDSIFNSGFSRGFSAATEWRINSVWHDVKGMDTWLSPMHGKLLKASHVGPIWMT